MREFSFRRVFAAVGISLLGLAALSSVLSVNTFPLVGNDSLLYLGHSLDLTGGGWVMHGFRQVGYPFFLAVARWSANVAGADPLLATAVLQRTLLIAGGVLAFWFWRWWSLPLLVYLFAAPTIAYSNFILTEGIGLPVALLLVFPTVSFLQLVQTDETRQMSRLVAVLGWSAVAGALILLTLRFTYSVFGVIPLVMAIATWKTAYRRLGLAALATYLVVAGAFTLLLIQENQREFGVALPSVDGGPAHYYYAWARVFTVNPDNRANPALAEFFDEGQIHAFSREVATSGVRFEEKGPIFDQEIEKMLRAAGISVLGSRVESVVWSLAGGRLHDVAGPVEGIVESTRSTIDRWIHHNSHAVTHGPQSFADEYNDSRLPQFVITDPVGVPLAVDTQSLAAVLLPAAIIVMALGLRYAWARPACSIGLTVVASTAVGLGWVRADNFRFLIASSTFGIALATSLLPRLAEGWERHVVLSTGTGDRT